MGDGRAGDRIRDGGGPPASGGDALEDDALEDDALEDEQLYEQLFHGQFPAMVRLAAMLGADDPEDLAQEAFVRLHRRTRTLRDPHAAVGYLRATVVNLTRSRLRHLAVVRRHPAAAQATAASAEQEFVRREAGHELVAALGRLSARHREALVLRYWLDLTEAEMADAMAVSRGTVKSHVSRGLDALAALMGGTR